MPKRIQTGNYEKALLSPYPFAIDVINEWTGKPSKKFIHNFDTIEEVNEYLKTDHHAYEIIKYADRKLYFDIDHTRFTKDKLDDYLDGLNKLVCKLLNTQDQEYIVMVNEPQDGFYKSIHLIYPNIVMNYLQIKKLVEYINTTSNYELDEKVYSKRNQFRSHNQSKLKNEKSYRMVFYGKEYPISEHYISETNGRPIYNFDKCYKQEQKKTQVKTPTEMIDLLIERNDDIVFKKCGIWKSLTALILKYPHIYPIKKWLRMSAENQPKLFAYEDNLNYIKNVDINDIGFYDENYIYAVANDRIKNQPIYYHHKSHDDTDIRNYLKMYFSEEIVNDCISFINLPNGHKTILFNFTYKGVEYQLNRIKGFITSKDFCINFYYDTIKPSEYKTIHHLENIEECGNHLQHYLRNKKLKTYILKSAWGTGKTFHIVKEAIKHFKHKRILIITSVNSLNQTNTSDLNEYLLTLGTDDLFASHLEAQHNKDIILNRRNKVVCSIQSLHKLDGNAYDLVIMDEFESILNAYYGYTTFKFHGVYSSFSQLKNILNKSNKLIVLDADISEPKVDLLKTIINDNDECVIYKNNTKSFQSNQFIIHADDNDDIHLHILDEVMNNKKLVIPSATRKSAKIILSMLGNLMNQENKLSKTDEKYAKLVNEYYDKIKHINILYISRDGCFVFITDGVSHIPTKYENEDVYRNMDAFLEYNNIDVFIYTPTITTGISINKPYFDKCYCIASNNSVVCNEFIQMIMRARILKDNETHIYISLRLFNIHTIQLTLDQVRFNQTAREKMFQELKVKNDELNVSSINDDVEQAIEATYDDDEDNNDYISLQLINACNLANTKSNFVYNIFHTLKYHGLNTKYNTTKPTIQPEYVNEVINERLTDEQSFELWDKIELLPLMEYIIEHTRHITHSRMKPYLDDELLIFTEEPNNDEDYLKRYYKTKHIFMLLNISKLDYKLIQDIFNIIYTLENESQDTQIDGDELDKLYQLTIQLTKQTHIKHSEYISQYGKGKIAIEANEGEEYNSEEEPKPYNILECSEMFIYEVITKYSMRALWKNYFKENDLFKVVEIRKFHNRLIKDITKMNYTAYDTKQIDRVLLRIFCDAIKIDFTNYDIFELTNKDFETIIKSLKENDEFMTSIYYYGKAHEITGIVEEDQTKTPTDTFKKEMYKLFKKLLKLIDVEVEYADKKHTIRPNDKIIIKPYNSLVKYPYVKLKHHKTLDEQHKHLTDLSIEMDNKIVSLELEELKKLLKKLETGKKVSVKDKHSIIMTLLRNEYTDDYERTIYRDLKVIFHKYYSNPLHYITFPSDTDHYLIEFWGKSRNKKELNIPLHHREITTYHRTTPLIDPDVVGVYEKGENKIITRPYEINEPNITTEKLPTHEDEGEEIVADILNKIINNVVVKSELIEKGEKCKKSIVEL